MKEKLWVRNWQTYEQSHQNVLWVSDSIKSKQMEPLWMREEQRYIWEFPRIDCGGLLPNGQSALVTTDELSIQPLLECKALPEVCCLHWTAFWTWHLSQSQSKPAVLFQGQSWQHLVKYFIAMWQDMTYLSALSQEKIFKRLEHNLCNWLKTSQRWRYLPKEY